MAEDQNRDQEYEQRYMTDFDRQQQFAEGEYERQVHMGLEQKLVLRSPHPQAVRYGMRIFMTEMFQAAEQAPQTENIYAASRMKEMLQNRQTYVELGLPEKTNLRAFLGLDDIGIVAHRLVQPIEAETIPDDQIAGITDPIKRGRLVAYNHKLETAIAANEALSDLVEAKRPVLAKTIEEETELLDAGAKLKKLYGAYEASAGSLTDIAKLFFDARNNHLTGKDYKVIFGARPTQDGDPAVSTYPLIPEAGKEGEAKPMGDNVDRAIRAYWAIGLCERPEELLKLRNKPGWEFLFEEKGGAEEREFIGDISRWATKKDKRTKGDLRRENRLGSRGKLTEFGNVWARAETTKEHKEIRERVKEMLDGDELAEEFAYRIFRVWGLAARFGTLTHYVPAGGKEDTGLEDERPDMSGSKLKVDQEGWPTSDALVQLMNTRAYQVKQATSGTAGGPYATRGRIARMLLSFPEHTVYDKPALGEDKSQPTHMRTVAELMWGRAGTQTRPVEPALRGRDLPFDDMDVNIHRKYLTALFFAAGEGKFFEYYMRAPGDWQSKHLTQEALEKLKLSVFVLFNKQLMLGGSFAGHSQDQIDRWMDGHDGIQGFKENMWDAIADGILEDAPANQQFLNQKGGLGVADETTETTFKKSRNLVWKGKPIDLDVVESVAAAELGGFDLDDEPVVVKDERHKIRKYQV